MIDKKNELTVSLNFKSVSTKYVGTVFNKMALYFNV